MPRTTEAASKISLYTYATDSKYPLYSRYTYDVNKFRDPIGVWRNKVLDGRSPQVQDWIKDDRKIEILVHEIIGLSHLHIQQQKESYLTIAFRDHHGKWISPAIAEIVADRLCAYGFLVSVTHRELPK